MREITKHRGLEFNAHWLGWVIRTKNGIASWASPPTRSQVNRIARRMKRRQKKDGREQVHIHV